MVLLMICLVFSLSDTHRTAALTLFTLPRSSSKERFMINCHRTDGLTGIWLYSKSMPCTALVCILDARKFSACDV